jgi:hypothetical protein
VVGNTFGNISLTKKATATSNYTHPGIPSSRFGQQAGFARCIAKGPSIINTAYTHYKFCSNAIKISAGMMACLIRITWSAAL